MDLLDERLTGNVIGGFFKVYNTFGFGFSETVYMNALALELRRRGLLVQREVPKEVFYLGQPIAKYKIDMVVERRLVIEGKAAKHLTERSARGSRSFRRKIGDNPRRYGDNPRLKS